ncbi:membrane protein [Christiangramia forsetii]|uniref:Uncharacterized protein n=2 Tax=Christiangramia forsetii TaxID=411153 RepID=A0M1D1_CHRFK|nr:membrane protein [Christiangramia forsetii]GGG42820.1 hypothetical protein GCM10011532_28370 [Christiangramia forsetii]CAL66426.1 conserved hypothetical protein, membrane [Christiangramia forsetii KT0803]
MEITGQAKTTAIVAYITILGTIIAYFMNLDPKDKFASFHIRQAFGINITFYLIGALMGMFNEGLIIGAFYLFFIVLWGYGIFMAIKGETREVPLLGPLFQKLFSTIS